MRERKKEKAGKDEKIEFLWRVKNEWKIRQREALWENLISMDNKRKKERKKEQTNKDGKTESTCICKVKEK